MANASGYYGARSADPDDGWGPATSFRSATGAGAAGYPGLDPRQDAYWDQPDHTTSARERLSALLPSARPRHERGLPSWGALLVLLLIAGLGGAIDMISGTSVRGWFNVGIVVASFVAILVVRRSGMFPIVIAPPIVYSLASGITLYIRSGGLNDRKVLIDSAANWLVYGFPAIAAATALVLIVAGVRLIIRK